MLKCWPFSILMYFSGIPHTPGNINFTYQIVDDRYTAAPLGGEPEFPELMDRIEKGLKLKITGKLDGIFEYYLDFEFKGTEFSLHFDDVMGIRIHLKKPRIANSGERQLLEELCVLLERFGQAGPPPGP